MASKRKNSLVANINRRKRAGKSRPKSRSSVSKDSYEQMQKGWPQASKKKAAKKKTSKKKASRTSKRGASGKTSGVTREAARTKSGGKRRAAKKK
ncbi:hypothetical protein JM946_16180 [Steroidobacter sp. S1-65]|uniref:Uncharacterized protein n=1 Tax=Steroidobacter gossypii TaxID=2805490 RepID=A0ABS1WZB5_9GAMM|nr:hypothetical protein [Steroidobacter gossypii]MBM0106272.1 hypothetical protein [Steroidobacter gossypii]